MGQQLQELRFPVIDQTAAFFRLEPVAPDRAADQPGVADDARLVLDAAHDCLVVRSQILHERLRPEGLRCFVVKSLEVHDDLRIELREADVRVEHRAELKDRVAHRQGVHVDEQDFVADEFQVLGMVIAVDHVVVMRNRFHHRHQLFPGLFRQVVFYEMRPVDGRLPHIREFALRHHGPVDGLEHLDVFLDAPIHLLRVLRQDLRERLRVEQFEDRAIAVPDADDVVRDGRRHAQDHRQSGDLAFVLDLIQRIRVVVDLDDIVPVDAVDRAIGAAPDDLAALDRNDLVGFLDGHHLREAGHVEDLVDLRTGPCDGDVLKTLAQPQDQPQPRAGDVLQFGCVDIERSRCHTFQDPVEFFPGRSRIRRVDTPRNKQFYFILFYLSTDFFHVRFLQ